MRRIDRQTPTARQRLVTTMATFLVLVTIFGVVEWSTAGLRAAEEGPPPSEILDLGKVSEEPVADTPTEVPTAVHEVPIDPTPEPTSPVDPTAEPVSTEIELEVPAPEAALDPPSPDDVEEFVPDLVGPTPTWAPEGGPGAVWVASYTCPTGYDASGSSLAVLEADCRADTTVTNFTVANDAGFSVTQTATLIRPPFMQQTVFRNVPASPIAISQSIPSGHGAPFVFCSLEALGLDDFVAMSVSAGNQVAWNLTSGSEPISIFFNFPESDGNAVTVDKYVCPPGVNAETDVLLDVCTLGGDGIEFEFVDGSGSRSGTVTAGSITWTDVVIAPVGELQIIETIPAGYGEPLVVCDGMRMDATGRFVVLNPGEARPFNITCNWFNFVVDDRGSLSLVKHDCPAGYDAWAPGADAFFDCTVIRDGVIFELTGAGVELTTTTGEGVGIADFPDLAPGDYVVTEWMPPGTASAFVADCFGMSAAAMQPFPLATSDTLTLTMAASDHVSCHWFNVQTAEHASLVLEKFTCSTLIYVAEVDCQVEEGGATFDLLAWDGGTWVVVVTLTTDGYGRATSSELAPGDYKVQEHGGPWCQMVSDGLGAGGVLTVEPETATVVQVYNCDGTPGKPGDLPTTFPNTGVPPISPNGGMEVLSAA